jgi:tRNA nucleotidyltransferase (CCA-adding enzyme)
LAIEIQLFLLALSPDEQVRRWISNYVTQWRATTAHLTGTDLAALGLKPGPSYRKFLDGLLNARLDNLVATRDDEVEWVRRHLPGLKRAAPHPR